MTAGPGDIVEFWRAAGPKAWFKKNEAFDDALRSRFEAAHFWAAKGVHDGWGETPEGSLALILLLDQVPRNLWRDTAHAFATDPLARAAARRAIAGAQDQALEPALRPFVYLPFEHSEDLADQDRGVALCQAHHDLTGDADTLKWARLHRDIILRFGRFPHRNRCLGRLTTPEEQAFLDQGGFAG